MEDGINGCIIAYGPPNSGKCNLYFIKAQTLFGNFS